RTAAGTRVECRRARLLSARRARRRHRSRWSLPRARAPAAAGRRRSRSARAASRRLLLVARQLGGVAGDERVLFGAGDDLEWDPFVARDQQAGAGRTGEQVAALASGEVEALADLGDRLRRLPQQK